MPNLYRVTVIARKAKKLQLSLQPTGHGLCLFVGPSFARMLIEESCAPGHAEYTDWRETKYASDENFYAQEAIAQVEVIASPAAPWPVELTVPFPEDIEARLGAAVLEIVVDDPGMIGHLKVDAAWLSTAFNELNDGTVFRGAPGDVLVWERSVNRRAPAAPSAPSACRLLEVTEDGVRVEFVTGAELPGLAPASWVRVLRDAYPGLNAHVDFAYERIASVEIEDIQGARDAKGSVLDWNAETHSLTRKGVLGARYRIVAKDKAWLRRGLDSAHPFATRLTDGWVFQNSPSNFALHAPSGSTGSEVSNFEALLELGRVESRASELEMLADGLQGTREVVLRALEEAGKLGVEATPLTPHIAACTGVLENVIAIAALDCAVRIGAPSLASAVALATLRLDAEVSAAAKRALKVFGLLPNWVR